jgi:hypothetical protein
MSIFINIDICCRETSPQITQIDTDYKKNQCNQCNLWFPFLHCLRDEARNHVCPTSFLYRVGVILVCFLKAL